MIVDLEHLSQYTSGDAALEDELFAMFLENGEHYVGLMSGAADQTAWRNASHALKGSARGIGAVRVAKLSAVAEARRTLPTGEDRNRIVRDLHEALAEVRGFASSRRPNPSAGD